MLLSSEFSVPLLNQPIIIWLNLHVGKMKQILCSDWLPERGRWAYLFFVFVFVFLFILLFHLWAYLACSGFLLWSCKKKSTFWPYNKSFIDQASLVMMLDIALILFGIFIYLDFISVHKNAMVNGQYPDLLTTRLVNNAYHTIHSLLPLSALFSRAIKISPPLSLTQCENFSAHIIMILIWVDHRK